MTRKTRLILFSVLLFCFLVIAPSLVFYSLGYRFNFSPLSGGDRIVKTGAFYFKILPKSSQISIKPLDNKGSVIEGEETTKKTDFLFGAALIENLLPKKYEVEIRKDGFLVWKKILEIKQNQVTENKNIVLMPEDTGINLLSKNIEDFFPSPNERIIILKEGAEAPATSSTNALSGATSSGWSLKVFEVQNSVKSQLISSQDISKTGQVELTELKFSSDSNGLLLKLKVKQQIKYYFLDLNQLPPKAVPLDFLAEEYQEVFFYPNNPQKLIVLKNGAVFSADIIQKKISSKIIDNVRSIEVSGQDIYYFDNSGFLFKTDFSFTAQEKINNIPFSADKNSGCRISVLAGSVFLNDGQKLYFLNPDSKSFEKFAEPNKGIKISPDFKKAVYYSDYEIGILFLELEPNQPQKEKGDKIFIARFSEKIDEVFWLTSHYLIFNSAAKIKVAEIDDRDVINIIDLAEFNSPKIFWNQNFRKLFVESEANFYASKELIP